MVEYFLIWSQISSYVLFYVWGKKELVVLGFIGKYKKANRKRWWRCCWQWRWLQVPVRRDCGDCSVTRTQCLNCRGPTNPDKLRTKDCAEEAAQMTMQSAGGYMCRCHNVMMANKKHWKVWIPFLLKRIALNGDWSMVLSRDHILAKHYCAYQRH